MDRFSYSNLGSLRNVRQPQPPRPYPEVVPFGPLGAGQWTGHPIGLFIALAFVLIALVGVEELRLLLVVALGLGGFLGCGLFLWHRSRSSF